MNAATLVNKVYQEVFPNGHERKVILDCPGGCGKTVIILENGDAQCHICKETFEPYDKK